MQLTRTNAVFSRIVLVSHFCAGNQLLKKYQKNHKSAYFARRLPEPEDEKGAASRAPTPRARAGGALAARGGGVADSATPSRPPLGYLAPPNLKNTITKSFPPETHRSAAATSKLNSGTRSSCSGTPPGRGIEGDHRHHFSINHPCFPHPCVSNPPL